MKKAKRKKKVWIDPKFPGLCGFGHHAYPEVFIEQEIPQLPPLPEGEKSAPLWTPDMKGTAEGNLMEWVLAMQLIHLQQKEIDGRIDWGIMKHVFTGNLEDLR